jgi:hypothetical protein
MVTAAETLQIEHWPDEHRNSIMHLVEPLNRHFGQYSDDALLTELAIVDPDSDIRHAKVELVGDVWQESGATDLQLGKVRRLIRIVHFRAGHIKTFGILRTACKKGKIMELSGAGVIGQNFLAGVIAERTPQVPKVGSEVESSLPTNDQNLS